MLAGAAAGLILAINLYLYFSTRQYILEEESYRDFPADVVLVLGCSVKPDGQPSKMLEDRMKRAVTYYLASDTGRMLVSGDHQSDDYNEVGVMRALAIAGGVPEACIDSDDYGLNTYASIRHVRELYPEKRVVIVSQSYHLYRALYLARECGIDAYGVSADLRPYAFQFMRELREIAARVKDFFQVTLFA